MFRCSRFSVDLVERSVLQDASWAVWELAPSERANLSVQTPDAHRLQPLAMRVGGLNRLAHAAACIFRDEAQKNLSRLVSITCMCRGMGR